jgi:hypothetical protein
MLRANQLSDQVRRGGVDGTMIAVAFFLVTCDRFDRNQTSVAID